MAPEIFLDAKTHGEERTSCQYPWRGIAQVASTPGKGAHKLAATMVNNHIGWQENHPGSTKDPPASLTTSQAPFKDPRRTPMAHASTQ